MADTSTSLLPLTEALDGLAALDPDIADARARFGDPSDRSMEQGYSTLARIILGQQISRAVATVLWERMQDKSWVDAETLAARSVDELKTLGISGRKSEYLIGLAEAVVSGSLNLETLQQMTGDEVRKTLTAIRGLGDWSANNYRLFALSDFDAWPGNDLALQEGMKLLKQLNVRPDLAGMERLAAGWKPYRGAGALMLWHIYAKLVRNATPSEI